LPNTKKQIFEVRVVAEYPIGRDFPIRRSHTFQIATSKIPFKE
jgi:hypothetical protein